MTARDELVRWLHSLDDGGRPHAIVAARLDAALAEAHACGVAEERARVLRELGSVRRDYESELGGYMTGSFNSGACEALDRLERRIEAPAPAETPAGEPREMCPNCVTPWKCNGPHTLQCTHTREGVNEIVRCVRNEGHEGAHAFDWSNRP